MREARDVQTLAGWVAQLAEWAYREDAEQAAATEPDVAAALLRLTDSATYRFRGTGQGTGITSHALAAGPTVTYMIAGGAS